MSNQKDEKPITWYMSRYEDSQIDYLERAFDAAQNFKKRTGKDATHIAVPAIFPKAAVDALSADGITVLHGALPQWMESEIHAGAVL